MPELKLETERLLLALPQPEQAQQAPLFLEHNRAHFSPWAPPAAEGLYTEAYWTAQIASIQDAFNNGSAVRLWLWAKDDPSHLIGTVGFSQVFRGPFCSCMLGYQLDQRFEGKGMMREALQAAIRYMFVEQKLHRIGANYRPENVRSGRLLTSLGFTIEGFAKNYLFIDGAWRDHVLTSITNDMFRPQWLAAPPPTTNETAYSDRANYKQKF